MNNIKYQVSTSCKLTGSETLDTGGRDALRGLWTCPHGAQISAIVLVAPGLVDDIVTSEQIERDMALMSHREVLADVLRECCEQHHKDPA